MIRIIAGDWRGSKLPVSTADGLRPTPDRIRETLFNWLAGVVQGARVLDCCAGAGGLGLEAASRRAATVDLVEVDRTAVHNLQQSISRLQAGNVKVWQQDVRGFLDQAIEPYDLVFIDPPYAEGGLREEILGKLLERRLLNPGAQIYLEWPRGEECALISPDLAWVKQKTAGAVCFAVAQWQ